MLENWINNWNVAIQDWNKSPEEFFRNDIFSTIYSGKDAFALLPESLPEPYFGNPYKNSAVILNLNPGPVREELQNRLTGTFITQGKAIENYNEFAKGFPYLTNFRNNKGGDWWELRKSWLNRLIKTKTGNQSTLFPFALEICPWHSQSWGKLNLAKNETKIYLENLFAIAEAINNNSELKVIVSVGKLYCKIFDYLGYRKLIEVNRYNFREFGLSYPTNKNAVPADRTFSLYESPAGTLIYNTWHTGGNKQPTSEWTEIEKFVLSFSSPLSQKSIPELSNAKHQIAVL
jgi:hypothetical protein